MRDTNVTIVGMGYAGLTLALVLSKRGFRVFGFDVNPQIIATLRQARSHIYEPAIEELLQTHLDRNLFISGAFPEASQDVVIVCVSTPIDGSKHPDLSNLKTAVADVSSKIREKSLVIIRSTVPVGTSRNIVLPILQNRIRNVHLAFCPERTIQGRAVEELEKLPQIVGGLDEHSAAMASTLFKKVAERVITVSSLECAELIKLVNNCHTDLLYSYGNQVALMAEKFKLDPLEVINAANLDYPRPEVAKPGFVGGGCLSKDPYLLVDSFRQFDYEPVLVRIARQLNEYLPSHVARTFWDRLTQLKKDIHKILICGFAFKGWPVTDDVRGTAVAPILDFLKEQSVDLYGHDYVVKPDIVESFGVTYVTVEDGFDGADAAIFVNNHPGYKSIEILRLMERMRKPALLLDCWGIFDKGKLRQVEGVHYSGIGYG